MRVYSVVFDGISVSALQDLFEIAPAANKQVRLLGLFLSNVGGTADAGDAEEELLRIAVTRGYATSGSGGASVTPNPVDGNDGAAGFTAERNNTTVASAGTAVVLHNDGFNVRVGFSHWWTPETQPRCTAGQTRIVVRLLAAPADAVALSGTLYVAED